jgi:hypothetical protein
LRVHVGAVAPATDGFTRQRYILLTPFTLTVVLAPAFAQAAPFEMAAACEGVTKPVVARSALTNTVATVFFNIFFLLFL